MTVKMEKHTARKYSSPIRERQANQTRTNILDATQRLFLERGYAKTTVEAIAQEAGVAKQTVYAVFRSKNGIVAELLDRAVFTERVFELHDRSLETANIHEALKLTAQLVLQVHESQSPVFDLLRGAGCSIHNWPASRMISDASTGTGRKTMCGSCSAGGGSRKALIWGWRWMSSGASPAATSTVCWCRSAGGLVRRTPTGCTRCSPIRFSM